MYVTDITDDNNNITLCNCTNNENNDTNIEIVIPLITIIPCVMSFLCLLSLMAYTLIKPLLNKKTKLQDLNIQILFVEYKWRSFFIQIILLGA